MHVFLTLSRAEMGKKKTQIMPPKSIQAVLYTQHTQRASSNPKPERVQSVSVPALTLTNWEEKKITTRLI